MSKRSNRNIHAFLNRAFLYLFIFVGVLILAGGCWNLFWGLQCAHWPTADGVVVGSEMRRCPGVENRPDTYYAEITYQYMVAGRQHEGNRLAFGSTSSDTQRILSRYPLQQKVTVHYSPNDPNRAVLETGVHDAMWFCFAVGTLFVLAGMMFLQFIGGSVTMNRPPVLMGVIFILMGVVAFFMRPTGGTPDWIVPAGGGFFIGCGLFLLLVRLKNKPYSTRTPK